VTARAFPTGVTKRGRDALARNPDATPVLHAVTSRRRGKSQRSRTAAMCDAPLALVLAGADILDGGMRGRRFDPENPRACPTCRVLVEQAGLDPL